MMVLKVSDKSVGKTKKEGMKNESRKVSKKGIQ